MLRAVLGECFGTFLFFFCVLGVHLSIDRVSSNDPNISTVIVSLTNAIAASLVSIAMIYSFSDISGAHFNPAVTLSTWLSMKTSNRKSALFVLAQITGSIAAIAALLGCFDDWRAVIRSLCVVPKSGQYGRAFFNEFMFVFILVFVIFTVAFENKAGPGNKKVAPLSFKFATNLTLYTADPQSKTGFAPLAIGCTIGFLCLIGSGSSSGGAFNPVRVFAPAIFNGDWTGQWVYWLGDFAGAIAAVGLRAMFVKTGIIPNASQATAAAPTASASGTGTAVPAALPAAVSSISSSHQPNQELSQVVTRSDHV